MDVHKIFAIAADIASIDEMLWKLVRDEIIENEDTRATMLREAMRWQFICGAANRHEDLMEAKQLVRFLRSAPMSVSLSAGVTIDESGNVTAYNPEVATSFA